MAEIRTTHLLNRPEGSATSAHKQVSPHLHFTEDIIRSEKHALHQDAL
jgi:hypothetical protein